MEVVIDDRAAQIAANLVATLEAATVDGKKYFDGGVMSCGELDEFTRMADPLRGRCAGVIAKLPERNIGEDNGQKWRERMSIEIAVSLSILHQPGAGESAATAEKNKVAAAVRSILLADPMRGGLARTISWSGSVIDGTQCLGAATLRSPKSEQAFFVAVVPATVGWYVPA